MLEFRVDQIFHETDYMHIDISVLNMPTPSGLREMRFKLFSKPDSSGLEFRNHVGWPDIFSVAPWQFEDAHGPKFVLTTGHGLVSELNKLTPPDLSLIECIVDVLPEAVNLASNQHGLKVDLSNRLATSAKTFCKEFKVAIGNSGSEVQATSPNPPTATHSAETPNPSASATPLAPQATSKPVGRPYYAHAVAKPEVKALTPRKAPIGASSRLVRTVLPDPSLGDTGIRLMSSDGEVRFHLAALSSSRQIVCDLRTRSGAEESIIVGYLSHSPDKIIMDLEFYDGEVDIFVNHALWARIPLDDPGISLLQTDVPSMRFERTLSPRPLPNAPMNVVGAIERMETDEIVGWVTDESSNLPVEMFMDGKGVELSAIWGPEESASSEPLAGKHVFRARVPDDLRHQFGKLVTPETGCSQQRISTRVGGCALSPTVRSVHGFFTALREFVLRGEVFTPPETTPRLRLCLNGVVAAEPIIYWREPAAHPAVANSCWGFEISIPGYVWSDLAKDEAAEINVLLDETPIEPKPLVLSRSHAVDVFRQIAEAVATKETHEQHILILAIEHLQYSDLLRQLEPSVANSFIIFARRMKLDGLLKLPPAQTLMTSPLTTEEIARLQIRRALDAVNFRMGNAGERLFPNLQAIVIEWDIGDDESSDLYLTLLPHLCQQNELPQLRAVADLSRYFHLEKHTNTWSLSIAVAVFICEAQIERASDALYKLSKEMSGWVNSSCLAFAAQHLTYLVARGLATHKEAERFRYGILAVLDGFQGDRFSRLHDVYNIDALLHLLSGQYSYSDYLAQDVVIAALRHYGLSEEFWSRWLKVHTTWPFSDPLLSIAHRQFEKLSAALQSPGVLDASLPVVQEALRFFDQYHNPESHWAAREVAMHALRPGRGHDPEGLHDFLRYVLARDSDDSVRIAAAPGGAPECGLEFLEITPGLLFNKLRAQQPAPRNLTYNAQRQGYELLLGRGVLTRPKQIDALLSVASVLSDSAGEYTGIDLLSLLAALQVKDRPGRDAAVNRFSSAVRSYLDATVETRFLPAPILAGIARLESLWLSDKDPFLAATVKVLHERVRRRFGVVHDEALARISRCSLPTDVACPAGDVIVAIYSCQKYLDSRVQAIRDTWLQDIKKAGIPYVIVVGEGDGSLHGDVLRLAVPDSYEELPSKTLGLVEWAVRNTQAQYLVKIDDDCYMHVRNYFGTFQYRSSHYYGRILNRRVGETDRAWHQLKSSGPRARCLDRSPEPSSYADGGGAYVLSRFAMTRILGRLGTPDGQRLRAQSFMEDKLIGDLLAMEGISPSNIDYGSYQRRRTFGNAIPVGMWENTFHPSLAAPSKMTHLDCAADQAVAHQLRDLPVLSPRRLWPSSVPASTARTVQQLEMLSNPDVMAPLDTQGPGVVLVVRNEIAILPHFLSHYRHLGVKAFYVVDNLSTDGSREFLAGQPDVFLYSVASDYKDSHYGVSWQIAILGQHFLGRWAIVVDADEFLIYPGWKKLPVSDLLVKIDAEGANAMPLRMVDMYPKGPLNEANLNVQSPFEAMPYFDRNPVRPWHLSQGYYGNRGAVVSTLRHRLLPDSTPESFTAEKVALFRYTPWIRLSEGLHSVANVKLSAKEAALAHFKYHSGFHSKVLEEVERKQHFNDAAEYRRYASLMAESVGNFVVDGVSVRLGADGYLPKDQ